MPEKKENVPIKKKSTERGEITPWRPGEYMQEMDRWFRDFRRELDDTFGSRGAGWGWMRPRFPWLSMPEVRPARCDLIDAGNEFRVRAEVPGIAKENLNITVTGRAIEIEGETKTEIQEEKEGFVRRERGYSKIQRSLAFPEEVVPDKAEATLKDGLLEIRVPKKTPTEVTKHRVVVK